MEAQTVASKPKRLSDLSFEPGFTLNFQMDFNPVPPPLDQEMVLSFIVGIDKRNPWYPPNDIPNEPDPIEVRWVGLGIPGGGEVSCTHKRNVIKEKHLDAYLRYIQTVGGRLSTYLRPYGVLHVGILLDLTSYIATFSNPPPAE